MLALIICSSATASVVITFEDLPPGGASGAVPVTNQYASQGVLFDNTTAQDYTFLPGFCHSGTRAVSSCYGVEFCNSPVGVSFTVGQTRVKLWIGIFNSIAQQRSVTLHAFDASNTEIDSQSVNVGPTSGNLPVSVPLEVQSLSAAIRRVTVGYDGNVYNFENHFLVVDDVEYETVGPPPPCLSTVPPVVGFQSPNTNGTTVQCNRFYFNDTVVTPDPYAVHTLTCESAAGLGKRTYQMPSAGASTWIDSLLYPGLNTLTDTVTDCKGTTSATRTITYNVIPASTTVTLNTMEVTQSVQTPNDGVELIAGKRTFVRAYLSLSGPLASLRPITARLYAYRPLGFGYLLGAPVPPYSITPLNSVNVVQNPDFTSQRKTMSATLNFEIPVEWTSSADRIHFELGNLAVDGCEGVVASSNFSYQNDAGGYLYDDFHDAPPLRIVAVPVPYRLTNTSPIVNVRQVDVDYLRSWLTRAYPTASVTMQEFAGFGRIGTPDQDFSADDVKGQLNDMRNLAVANGTVDPKAHWVGLVEADGGAFMRGKGDLPGHVCAGPCGTPNGYKGYYDASYAGWYDSHEVGHTFGRYHAEFCGATGGAAYPYPNGLISPVGPQYIPVVGFDVGDASIGAPVAIYPGDAWSDLMTYCNLEWVSDFTYAGILAGMRQQESQPSLVFRKPHGAPNDALMLSANVNYTKDTITLRPFWHLSGLAFTTLPATSDFTVVLQDSHGAPLATYPIAANQDSEPQTGFDQTGDMSAVVPWATGTKRISFQHKGVEKAFRVVTPNSPQVQVTAPAAGVTLGGGSATAQWLAQDNDLDPLTYTLEYSTDNGSTWRILDTTITATSFSFDPSTLPGSKHATFRVVASDGVNTGSGDSPGPFINPASPPAVTIASPMASASFTSNQTEQLAGAATDITDGTLTGLALVWTSSVQGTLGTGTAVTTQLLPGHHVITLTATNAASLTGSASVAVDVAAAAPMAMPGPDRWAVVGLPVTLDGSGSSGVPNLTFTWKITQKPDGSATALSDPHATMPVIKPDLPGSYTIQLSILDGTGTTAMNQVVVTATNVVNALKIAGGLINSLGADFGGMNVVVSGASANVIDILDAVALARIANEPHQGSGSVIVGPSNRYSSYGVFIDDPRLDNWRDARIIACHQYLSAFNAGPVAVWYYPGPNKWVIYNDDGSPMPDGEKFNYTFGPAVHSAVKSSADPFAYAWPLPDPGLDANAAANVLATHFYVGAYNPSPIGVNFYNNTWAAYNESPSAIPNGEIVFFTDAGANGGRIVRGTGHDYFSYGVFLDDPRIDGNPNAIVLAQHQGIANFYNTPIGVFYWVGPNKWVAYSDNTATMPTGEAINYLIGQ